jgi:hypothetical protein
VIGSDDDVGGFSELMKLAWRPEVMKDVKMEHLA